MAAAVAEAELAAAGYSDADWSNAERLGHHLGLGLGLGLQAGGGETKAEGNNHSTAPVPVDHCQQHLQGQAHGRLSDSSSTGTSGRSSDDEGSHRQRQYGESAKVGAMSSCTNGAHSTNCYRNTTAAMIHMEPRASFPENEKENQSYQPISL